MFVGRSLTQPEDNLLHLSCFFFITLKSLAFTTNQFPATSSKGNDENLMQFHRTLHYLLTISVLHPYHQLNLQSVFHTKRVQRH